MLHVNRSFYVLNVIKLYLKKKNQNIGCNWKYWIGILRFWNLSVFFGWTAWLKRLWNPFFFKKYEANYSPFNYEYRYLIKRLIKASVRRNCSISRQFQQILEQLQAELGALPFLLFGFTDTHTHPFFFLFAFSVLQVRGVNFEAVLRLEEDEANSKRNASKREVEDDLGLSMLIDSQNNQYILTKPRDSTIPRADHHFIKVTILEMFLSFVLVRCNPTSLYASTAWLAE